MPFVSMQIMSANIDAQGKSNLCYVVRAGDVLMKESGISLPTVTAATIPCVDARQVSAGDAYQPQDPNPAYFGLKHLDQSVWMPLQELYTKNSIQEIKGLLTGIDQISCCRLWDNSITVEAGYLDYRHAVGLAHAEYIRQHNNWMKEPKTQGLVELLTNNPCWSEKKAPHIFSMMPP